MTEIEKQRNPQLFQFRQESGSRCRLSKCQRVTNTAMARINGLRTPELLFAASMAIHFEERE
jgi:hypothetical protein